MNIMFHISIVETVIRRNLLLLQYNYIVNQQLNNKLLPIDLLLIIKYYITVSSEFNRLL